MMYPLISSGNRPMPLISLIHNTPPPKQAFCHSIPIHYFPQQNLINTLKTHLLKPPQITPNQFNPNKAKKNRAYVEGRDIIPQVAGSQQMLFLCGFGYWVQGFRCFPWLALNYHMAHNLNLLPSILQLVQNSGNLPMVAKPLYGILSDALYIGGAHRIPYISIGALLQVLSWAPLALIPFAGKSLPTIVGCVLLGNLGASITEVSKDALVAEYGQKNKMGGLQSYAFMALATGGILGNLLGGFFLSKAQQLKPMFLIFAALLSLQLTISLTTREDSLCLPQPSSNTLLRPSISEIIKKQYSNLMVALSDETISRPLVWLVSSTALVPILSGSMFCYQTQCLNLDPSILGMSRVMSQLMLLSTTLVYDRYWRIIPMRKLIGITQILYASSFLLDLVLVNQVNLKVGIPNDVFALCFSGVAESIVQFKLLPFQVFFASLAPPGCEGSLMSIFASVLCLSSIFSGVLGVGLSSLLGITSGDYSSLPVGIGIQFVAALVSLQWIYHLPMSQPSVTKERKRGRSIRTRRNRRVGRVGLNYFYAYRRERESEPQR